MPNMLLPGLCPYQRGVREKHVTEEVLNDNRTEHARAAARDRRARHAGAARRGFMAAHRCCLRVPAGAVVQAGARAARLPGDCDARAMGAAPLHIGPTPRDRTGRLSRQYGDSAGVVSDAMVFPAPGVHQRCNTVLLWRLDAASGRAGLWWMRSVSRVQLAARARRSGGMPDLLAIGCT